MNIYKSVLGWEFETLSYFKDEQLEIPRGMYDEIMHIDYRIGDITIMGSDSMQGEPKNNRALLSLSFDTSEKAKKFSINFLKEKKLLFRLKILFGVLNSVCFQINMKFIG